ncbi:MAG: Internalin-A precursor [Pelotomaculum sp. PtaB.Bin104]|nr:MAG: Internalin-A precursor [Pelotomaculum sp. PtaB.Bin104]
METKKCSPKKHALLSIITTLLITTGLLFSSLAPQLSYASSSVPEWGSLNGVADTTAYSTKHDYTNHISKVKDSSIFKTTYIDMRVTTLTTEVVHFNDAKLEAVIREAIKKPVGDITNQDLAGLIALAADQEGILDLTGLEYAINLQTLTLCGNHIDDVTPLAGLTNLVMLGLDDNQISDISPLAGLTKLNTLWLDGNGISNITPLAGLTDLEAVCISRNQLSDISPLEGLINLLELWLVDNQISDIDTLASLIELKYLYLDSNMITDISPLNGPNFTQLEVLSISNNRVSTVVSLANQENLNDLYLTGNQLSDIGFLTGLNNLELLYLDDNEITNIAPLAGLVSLKELKLNDNSITDISPLANLTNLYYLNLWSNKISDIYPLVVNSQQGGFGSENYLFLENNYLNTAPGTKNMNDIQLLIDSGVEVSYLPQNSLTFGDVNCDGLVDILDLLWMAAKIGPSSIGPAWKADVNNDGAVNILDLLMVHES